MKLKVDVTQKHIDEGVPRSSDSCPIALAIGDMGKKVEVSGRFNKNKIWILGSKEDEFSLEYIAEMTKKAIVFTRNFDTARKVYPDSFTFVFKENCNYKG